MTETGLHPWLVTNVQALSPRIDQLRQDAATYALQVGIPTQRHEEWKYVSLKHVGVDKFQPVPTSASAATLPAGYTAACINGHWLVAAGTGFEISTLAQKLPLAEQHLGQYALWQEQPLVAFNTANLADALVIHVPAKAVIAEPIKVLVLATGADPITAHPRILVVLGSQAEATLIIEQKADALAQTLINTVEEMVLGSAARLEVIRVQHAGTTNSFITHTEIHQERDSYANTITVTGNGQLFRNNLHFRLNGSNIESHMSGLYLASGKTVIDNHTLADHLMPNSHSNELYKGIVSGNANAIFNGKIFVRQDAQKTNAYQSNKNILLSDSAQVNTKPQLEIYADDVKCSHGCTVGSLDEEPLFYLRSRGLDPTQARSLLLEAFALDVLAGITNETIHAEITEVVAAWLNELAVKS